MKDNYLVCLLNLSRQFQTYWVEKSFFFKNLHSLKQIE